MSLGVVSRADAQDIEPRTYSNAPIGVNFLIAGYAYTRGALQFDTALDLKDAHLNWRLGATFAIPVDRKNSVKLHASSGLSDRTGNSFDLLGVAWQRRWGGGL